MIPVEEALNLVLGNLPPVRTERVRFTAALGRVLAEDVTADRNIPPFDRSAMDGYAVRAADVKNAPVRLELSGEIPAGTADIPPLPPGQAMAIMTGAPLPEGADAVQMIEETELSPGGGSVSIRKAVAEGENVRACGSEAAAGETVLEAGRFVGPAEIAVLATFGRTEIDVCRRPTAAVLATGDEIVEVDRAPGPGRIRNSNPYSLACQFRQLGIEAEYLGIARDDRAEVAGKVREGLASDVLVVSGGVSVGKYDFVKDVFRELGVEILFSKVAMKPGKPTVFGRKGDRLVFGLPGNPVSTLVAFENFVRPAVGRLCGLPHPELARVKGELLRDMRQTPGRTSFLPARVRWEAAGWKIDPLAWKGSGDIIGFSRANATVIFPRERNRMARGENVEAMLLPDYFSRSRP